MSLAELIENSRFLFTVGVFSVIWVVFKILFNFFTHYKVYHTNSLIDYKNLDKWALVTGATDGIGKGITQNLAAKGFNIVLVSRNPLKLQNVANELTSSYHIQTRCIAFDFTKSVSSMENTTSVYDRIQSEVQDLKIGILVNNVGMATPFPDQFLLKLSRYGTDLNDKIIHCNVTSMAKITEIVLPGMVERGKGVIINLSSGLSSVIFPGMALYSGSKRFNDSFSKALSYEYGTQGIFVQSIQPGVVDTNMTKDIQRRKYSLTSPTAHKFAANLLQSTGKTRMTNGYWIHALQMSSLSYIPTTMFQMGTKIMGERLKIRVLQKNSEQVQQD